MKISLVIPCHNEANNISTLYHETISVLSSLHCNYEMIMIDDGSTDATLQAIKELSSTDSNVKYISFSRNFGKEAAMYAGLNNSTGDYVAIMDADLQDPPSLLPEMMKILDSHNYDCVATRRSNRKGEKKIRSFFAKMFYKLINKISDTEIVDGARDFRLMSKDMVNAIISMNEYNRFSKGIFGWVGFKTHWISYENTERSSGESNWSITQLFKYALDGIISFSQTPLLLSSYLGILMTILAIAMLLVIVVSTLIWGNPVDGWASTACIIIFVGGLQLFCLGITSQYIARVFLETKHRPHYIINNSNIADIEKIK